MVPTLLLVAYPTTVSVLIYSFVVNVIGKMYMGLNTGPGSIRRWCSRGSVTDDHTTTSILLSTAG